MDNSRRVTLPHLYEPRPSYQLPVWQAYERGCRRFVCVWHRRAGKDVSLLNLAIRASQERPGVYWHVFPELKRARKVLWQGRNREGRPFLEHFPPEFVAAKNEAEMTIRLTNNSIWQLIGMNDIDANIGANPCWITFSEYSQMSGRAWELLRPVITENQGTAAFIFTPRGRNHAFELYQMALTNPAWYCSLLTVEDTRRDALGENGLPIVSAEDIARERAEGMPEALVRQEYFCDFNAASALQFISGDLIELACHRSPAPHQWAPIIVGVDVGRNRDRSVILVRQGPIILEKLIFHPYEVKDNPTAVVGGQVIRVIQAYTPQAVFIDAIGIGAGVVDYVRQHTRDVITPVWFGSQPTDPRYFNKRAECWGLMRDWLRTQGHLDRARDRVLIAELQLPQYRWKGDKEWLTPKDELEDSGGELEGYQSPDEADSLSLTFAEPVSPRASTQRRQAQPALTDWNPLTYDQPRQRAQQAKTDWDPLRS
jgi:hypothetical protein